VILAVAGWLGHANLDSAHVFRNDTQEVRQVSLPDGSRVALNPNSEIYLRWTAAERRLDLRHGRARFQVAKNPQRPFLVDTRFGTVRAVGTIFDVDAQRRETRITVIEGKVAVESVGAPKPDGATKPSNATRRDAVNNTLQLSAGDRAKIMGDDTAGSSDITPGVVAWTDERVVFRGATLDTVVDEFNRYQSRPIIINDSRLAPLIISGVFDPKNPDSLLSYLELYEGVKVERMEDGSVLASLRN
jgi:transmembrane sensor